MNRMRAFAAAVLGLVVLASCDPSSETSQPTVANRSPGVLIVSYAPDSTDTFPAPKVDSLLALEWLQIYANSRGLDISTRQYAFGDLLIHIGPRRSGDRGDWFYTVNGQMATEAVSKLRVSRTDTLEFTFK